MTSLGVQTKVSANLAAEFEWEGLLYLLGTYGYTGEAVCACGIVAWRFGWLRHDLSFPEIETREDGEFLGAKNFAIHSVEGMKKKLGIHIAPGESDEAALSRFTREYPQYV
ncbi:hypothetical protein D1007_30246 [Hordeum vulgare]|nr:hypothetical protein D1007_30246 [Hordeum vulgare]